MAVELFAANRATTTVSSGGTDAPASGTTETWTVASSAMFGAAAAGVSRFHVADPLAPAEMIAVTNVSGTTWTVTRGAESTTPVPHAAGFTVYQVVTTGFLGTALQAGAGSAAVPLVMVPPPSGDASGVTDQAAIQALENAADVNGAILVFAPGTYQVTGLTKQALTIWQGAGRLATTIKLANGANADVVQGANFTTLTLSGSAGGIAGWGIRDLSIDGNKASQSGTSYGLRVYGYEFDVTRVSIRNCHTDCLYTEWSQHANPGADSSEEATYTSLKLHDSGGNGWVNRGPTDSRAYDVTIFHNATGLGTSIGYWGQAGNPVTVASGSNGANVSTFAGSGTLNVSTTLGYPAASINAAQGSLTVATSGGTAVITYTGTTATSFTGCTTMSGSGTLSTGGAVSMTGGGYSSAGALLEGVHVYGGALWDYILDTQAHLTDCIGEVSGSSSGGTVLVRGNTTSQITGGLYVCYPVETQAGCGIQIGDTANFCFGLRVDTFIFGFAGTSAATAGINVVNDGGGNSVDALLYQTSGTSIWSGGSAGAGAVSSASRYRVYGSGGANLAADAAQGVEQTAGLIRRYLPGSSNPAYLLSLGASADIVAINTSTNAWLFAGGVLTRWYTDQYTTSALDINGANGHIIPRSGSLGSLQPAPSNGTYATGAAVSANCSDTAGQVTGTMVASPGAGSILTVTFKTTWGNHPVVVITPTTAAAAQIQTYLTQGFGFFTINAAVAPPAGVDSQAVGWNYIVLGQDT